MLRLRLSARGGWSSETFAVATKKRRHLRLNRYRAQDYQFVATPSPEARSGVATSSFPSAPALAGCFHGGRFFEAIGPRFDALGRAGEIINADVLDAWFPPSPRLVAALRDDLPWLARTSPPTACEGLVDVIAQTRGVERAAILPGAGSSDLIFRCFLRWLTPASTVLLLDPTYGEYAHVLERVVGCRVERLLLSRDDEYDVDPGRLGRALARGPDLVVLVNPNSPTGRHLARERLESILRRVPPATRVWIDETYVEYVGAGESLERFAARTENVFVCKSMSKVYALSGMRVAYLCGGPRAIAALRAITPPWVVGLPVAGGGGAGVGGRGILRRPPPGNPRVARNADASVARLRLGGRSRSGEFPPRASFRRWPRRRAHVRRLPGARAVLTVGRRDGHTARGSGGAGGGQGCRHERADDGNHPGGVQGGRSACRVTVHPLWLPPQPPLDSKARGRQNFPLTLTAHRLFCLRFFGQKQGKSPGRFRMTIHPIEPGTFSLFWPVKTGRREPLPTGQSARIAQLAEHVLGKDEVSGSIPLAG